MVALGKVRVCELCLMRAAEQAETDILCTRCGDALGMESARFAAGMGVTECSLCRMAPPEFERAVAFGTYDNEMREMLHLLKFGGQRRMAEVVLGERLAAAMLKLDEVCGRELLVVPVPLFPARERQRGFNQARLLADAAIKSLKKLRPEWRLRMLPGAMQRVRDTHALFTLNPSQRRRNLSGAFRIADKDAVRGREVLLDRRHHDHRSDGSRVCAGIEARGCGEGLGRDRRQSAAGERTCDRAHGCGDVGRDYEFR